MGQRQTKNEAFTGVLPGSQRTKGSIATASSPPACRPAEKTVPVIETPPHALVAQSETNRLETARRGGDEGTTFLVPESVRKSRTLEQFEHTCSEILPDLLFVSNLLVAQDETRLRRLGITHVINCCKEVISFPNEKDTAIAFLQLAIRDGVQEDLLPFFPLVIDFIEVCREEHGRVLIHCHQGVSRSCAFAIAYVMFRERIGFHEANAFGKSKRAICSPNAAFICQLIEWEHELTADLPTSRGLYRLAPHASYDPAMFVLKLCYERDSRRKAQIPATSDGNRLPSTALWSRGIFVFLDDNKRVVIWKGRKCVIENGVETAKKLATQMLRVLIGDGASKEMVIEVVEDTSDIDGADHFQYAYELAWLDPSVPEELSLVNGPHFQVPEAIDTNLKPKLFLRESSCQGSVTWELLTNYDSDDLLAQHILLLISPHYACVWVGSDHDESSLTNFHAEATQQANLFTTLSELGLERQDHESESFWEAFEAGY